jgi:hypothetical protein
MKASLFYRIAAVLLLLFAVGHTLGFRQSDPTWGVDTLLGSMRSIYVIVYRSSGLHSSPARSVEDFAGQIRRLPLTYGG